MGEIRVTFGKNEAELEAFVKSKTSGAGYLKDIATVEMKKEKLYIESANIDMDLLANMIVEKLSANNISISETKNNNEVPTTIDIDELDIDDIDI
jgi:hypothetical protein